MLEWRRCATQKSKINAVRVFTDRIGIGPVRRMDLNSAELPVTPPELVKPPLFLAQKPTGNRVQTHLMRTVGCHRHCWWYNGTLWSSRTQTARSPPGCWSSPAPGTHRVSAPVREKRLPGGLTGPSTNYRGLRHQNSLPWRRVLAGGWRPLPIRNSYKTLVDWRSRPGKNEITPDSSNFGEQLRDPKGGSVTSRESAVNTSSLIRAAHK